MERTEQDGIICACLQVTERQLQAAVQQNGAQTVRELILTTGAGTGCTACHRRLESCLARWSSSGPPPCLPEPPGARENGRAPLVRSA